MDSAGAAPNGTREADSPRPVGDSLREFVDHIARDRPTSIQCDTTYQHMPTDLLAKLQPEKGRERQAQEFVDWVMAKIQPMIKDLHPLTNLRVVINISRRPEIKDPFPDSPFVSAVIDAKDGTTRDQLAAANEIPDPKIRIVDFGLSLFVQPLERQADQRAQGFGAGAGLYGKTEKISKEEAEEHDEHLKKITPPPHPPPGYRKPPQPAHEEGSFSGALAAGAALALAAEGFEGKQKEERDHYAALTRENEEFFRKKRQEEQRRQILENQTRSREVKNKADEEQRMTQSKKADEAAGGEATQIANVEALLELAKENPHDPSLLAALGMAVGGLKRSVGAGIGGGGQLDRAEVDLGDGLQELAGAMKLEDEKRQAAESRANPQPSSETSQAAERAASNAAAQIAKVEDLLATMKENETAIRENVSGVPESGVMQGTETRPTGEAGAAIVEHAGGETVGERTEPEGGPLQAEIVGAVIEASGKPLETVEAEAPNQFEASNPAYAPSQIRDMASAEGEPGAAIATTGEPVVTAHVSAELQQSRQDLTADDIGGGRAAEVGMTGAVEPRTGSEEVAGQPETAQQARSEVTAEQGGEVFKEAARDEIMRAPSETAEPEPALAGTEAEAPTGEVSAPRQQEAHPAEEEVREEFKEAARDEIMRAPSETAEPEQASARVAGEGEPAGREEPESEATTGAARVGTPSEAEAPTGEVSASARQEAHPLEEELDEELKEAARDEIARPPSETAEPEPAPAGAEARGEPTVADEQEAEVRPGAAQVGAPSEEASASTQQEAHPLEEEVEEEFEEAARDETAQPLSESMDASQAPSNKEARQELTTGEREETAITESSPAQREAGQQQTPAEEADANRTSTRAGEPGVETVADEEGRPIAGEQPIRPPSDVSSATTAEQERDPLLKHVDDEVQEEAINTIATPPATSSDETNEDIDTPPDADEGRRKNASERAPDDEETDVIKASYEADEQTESTHRAADRVEEAEVIDDLSVVQTGAGNNPLPQTSDISRAPRQEEPQAQTSAASTQQAQGARPVQKHVQERLQQEARGTTTTPPPSNAAVDEVAKAPQEGERQARTNASSPKPQREDGLNGVEREKPPGNTLRDEIARSIILEDDANQLSAPVGEESEILTEKTAPASQPDTVRAAKTSDTSEAKKTSTAAESAAQAETEAIQAFPQKTPQLPREAKDRIKPLKEARTATDKAAGAKRRVVADASGHVVQARPGKRVTEGRRNIRQSAPEKRATSARSRVQAAKLSRDVPPTTRVRDMVKAPPSGVSQKQPLGGARRTGKPAMVARVTRAVDRAPQIAVPNPGDKLRSKRFVAPPEKTKSPTKTPLLRQTSVRVRQSPAPRAKQGAPQKTAAASRVLRNTAVIGKNPSAKQPPPRQAAMQRSPSKHERRRSQEALKRRRPVNSLAARELQPK